MSLLSVWMLELSLYTHGPLLRTMKFQLSVCLRDRVVRRALVGEVATAVCPVCPLPLFTGEEKGAHELPD